MNGKCSNKDKNMKNCTCSYSPCDKKGICCECIEYHRRRKEIPGCFFTPEGEKTWDRSIARFLKDKH